MMMTSHIHQSRYRVTLPGGRKVDIRTQEGVHACLKESAFCKDYVSTTLQDAIQIRQKAELDQEDKNCLTQAYTLMHFLSLNADTNTNILLEGIRESDIHVWYNDIAIDEIKKLSTKPSWVLTGILDIFEESVLNPCTTLACHAVPVAIALEGEFFQVLANFIRARQGGSSLPAPMICTQINSIIFWSLSVATTRFDPCWSKEKYFDTLESSGMLEQFLRVVTVPQFPESDTLMSNVLDTLASCRDLLSKKFKKGTPCGDTLRAIADGKDGSKTERPVIMQRLRGLVGLVDMMKPMDDTVLKSQQCGHCGKSGTSKEFQLSLLLCSRCRLTRYCSKECQRADWKEHKKTCVPATSKPGDQKPPASN
mmetsp:Transcript_19975/g.49097  ORF Transcript_19975/g.49097 Transcript_19975/m.49097 type:complete len:366 (+) Transcript_19975:78-1175(+)